MKDVKLAVCVGVVALSFVTAADTITLRGSDPTGWSSFVTNVVGESVGWSNQEAPSANHDYVVSGKILNTPTDKTSSTRHTFAGKSLTLQSSGKLKIFSYAPSSVDLGSSVVLKSGSIGTHDTWVNSGTTSVDLYGTVAIGATSVSSAEFNTSKNGEWRYHLTLTGGSDKAFRFYKNVSMTSFYGSGAGAAYARDMPYTQTNVIDGDFGAYYGSAVLAEFVVVQLDSAHPFGGSFTLKNLTQLAVKGTQNAQTIQGNLTSSDAWVNVGASKSLSVGNFTSAFAPTNTFFIWRSHKDFLYYENVYTGERVSEGYVYEPRHELTYSGRTAYLNTLTLGANAEFSAVRADLSATRLELGAGSEMTVGDLIASNVVVKTDGGVIHVTNSLTVTTPIEITMLTGSFISGDVFTLPVGKGTLSLDQFKFSCRYRPTIVIRDGLQVLTLENIAPTVMDETTGFVVMTNQDNSSGTWGTPKNWSTASYDGVGAPGFPNGMWKDGCAPGPGKKYYTNNKYFRQKDVTVFGGDRLVLSSSFRITSSARSLTVADWVLKGNGESAINKCANITTSGGIYTTKLYGKMTVLTTRGEPFMFNLCGNTTNKYGVITAYQTWDFQNELLGDADAMLMFGREYSTSADTFTNPTRIGKVKFFGDASKYFGTFMLRKGVIAEIGSNLANVTIEQHDRSEFNLIAEDGADIAIAKYVVNADETNHVECASWMKIVGVPAANTLSVGALDIAGGLVKKGEGVMKVPGTATVGADASLVVSNGFIQAKSESAFNGLDITFADGTGFVVDVEDAQPIVLSGAVTAADTVVADVRGLPDKFGGERRVVLAKVREADATAFADALRFKHVKGIQFSDPIVSEPDASGLVTISTDASCCGFIFLVR